MELTVWTEISTCACIEEAKKARVMLRSQPLQDLIFLDGQLKPEWAVILVGVQGANGFIVEDIFLPQQKVTGGHFDLVQDWHEIETEVKAIWPDKTILGTLHRHPGSMSSLSRDDKDSVAGSFPLTMLLHDGQGLGKFSAWTRVTMPCDHTFFAIVSITVEQSVATSRDWAAEIKEKITEPVAVSFPFQGGFRHWEIPTNANQPVVATLPPDKTKKDKKAKGYPLAKLYGLTHPLATDQEGAQMTEDEKQLALYRFCLSFCRWKGLNRDDAHDYSAAALLRALETRPLEEIGPAYIRRVILTILSQKYRPLTQHEVEIDDFSALEESKELKPLISSSPPSPESCERLLKGIFPVKYHLGIETYCREKFEGTINKAELSRCLGLSEGQATVNYWIKKASKRFLK